MEKANSKEALNLSNNDKFITPYTLGLCLQNLSKCPYRVGDVLISTISENPSVSYPGTEWELIKDEFIVGAGNKYSLGSTGGSEIHAHSAGSLVACYDPINYYSNQLFRLKNISGGFTLSGYINQSNSWSNGGGSGGRGIEVVGSTQNTNVLPPYRAFNIWLRTK